MKEMKRPAAGEGVDVFVFDSRDYPTEEAAKIALDEWIQRVFDSEKSASVKAEACSKAPPAKASATEGQPQDARPAPQSEGCDAGCVDFNPKDYPTRKAALAAFKDLIFGIFEQPLPESDAIQAPTSSRLQ